MTTNVINKGWFNPISLSVLLILVIVSAVVCFEDYKHTDIHPLASSFRVGDFCNPHSRPMGTSGSPSYGEIQRFERSRPLYDYPGYRQCIDLY